MRQSFAQFGAGPDGAAIAFWLYKGKDTSKAPVVLLSGDDYLVLAKGIRDFVALLGVGHYDLTEASLEPTIDQDDLAAFREWMKEKLGISPARGGATIVNAARRAHPELRAWVWGARHPGGIG